MESLRATLRSTTDKKYPYGLELFNVSQKSEYALYEVG